MELEGHANPPLGASCDPEDILEYAAKMRTLQMKIYEKAKNIDAAQKKDKFYYDKNTQIQG